MKATISIPDELLREAERTAKRLGVSRSELFTRAVREFLSFCREVTASYNDAFADGDEGEDAAFRREAARRLFSRLP